MGRYEMAVNWSMDSGIERWVNRWMKDRKIFLLMKLIIASKIWYTHYSIDVISVFKCLHDDVIKWKHFPRNWQFVRGIHRSSVNSPHKGQWRGALMFSLICVWINDWVNNREAGDLRRYRAHYDVIVMKLKAHNRFDLSRVESNNN